MSSHQEEAQPVVLALCMPVYDGVTRGTFATVGTFLIHWMRLRPPGWYLKLVAVRAQPVMEARNLITAEALRTPPGDFSIDELVGHTGCAADLLLWIDSDVSLPNPADLLTLATTLHHAPTTVGMIAAPLAVQDDDKKKLVRNVRVFEDPSRQRSYLTGLGELPNVWAVGAGLCVVRASVYRDLAGDKGPWYHWRTGGPEHEGYGEDFKFCADTRGLGFDILVAPIRAAHDFRRPHYLDDPADAMAGRS